MSQTDQFPPIPSDLLTALQDRFRDQVPDISHSDREVWAKVGEQRVIRFLKHRFEEQNENVLDTAIT